MLLERIENYKLPYVFKLTLIGISFFLTYRIYSPTGSNYIDLLKIIKPRVTSDFKTVTQETPAV